MMMLGAFIALGFGNADALGLPFGVVVLAAMVSMFFVGWGIERVFVRQIFGQPQFALVILTIALGFALRFVAGSFFGYYQNTRFVMADLRSRLDATQAYLDQCVVLANEDRLTPKDAASATLICSELQGEVVDAGVQYHGGAGDMQEFPIVRMFQDARIARICAGTSEIMKGNIGRGLGLDARAAGKGQRVAEFRRRDGRRLRASAWRRHGPGKTSTLRM